MAVLGSVRHMVWLQRFDGHTETNNHSYHDQICASRHEHNACCCLPPLSSSFICMVISSWLDSLFFLGVEARSMSSARLSMSSELQEIRTLLLGPFGLAVLSFPKNHNKLLIQHPCKLWSFSGRLLTGGQTGGLVSIAGSLVSTLLTWISEKHTLSTNCEEFEVICGREMLFEREVSPRVYTATKPLILPCRACSSQ